MFQVLKCIGFTNHEIKESRRKKLVNADQGLSRVQEGMRLRMLSAKIKDIQETKTYFKAKVIFV